MEQKLQSGCMRGCRLGKGDEYDRKPGPGTPYLDTESAPAGVKHVNDTAAFLKYCSNASERCRSSPLCGLPANAMLRIDCRMRMLRVHLIVVRAKYCRAFRLCCALVAKSMPFDTFMLWAWLMDRVGQLSSTALGSVGLTSSYACRQLAAASSISGAPCSAAGYEILHRWA